MRQGREGPGFGDAHEGLFELLEQGVVSGVFPGCVALVSRGDAIVYHEAHGTLATHPASVVSGEPAARDTLYDLASLTKVLATTTLFAIAVRQSRVAWDSPVPAPWAVACPSANLADVLEHCAGFVAHREFFTQVVPYDAAAVLSLVAETPPADQPRRRACYSDLGFLVLGAWLERLFDGALEQVFADHVAYPLGLDQRPLPRLGFRPLPSGGQLSSSLERRLAPTEVYDPGLHPLGAPAYLPLRRAGGEVAHGSVHDDNAWVMGCGTAHAGLFGDAAAVHEVARGWLHATIPGFTSDERDRCWQPSKVVGSTRCLGFDRPNPDGTSATGSALSPAAVGHTGFTGTSLWIDPAPAEEPRIYVLLSNRVHPTRDNKAITTFRQEFHQLAARL